MNLVLHKIYVTLIMFHKNLQTDFRQEINIALNETGAIKIL